MLHISDGSAPIKGELQVLARSGLSATLKADIGVKAVGRVEQGGAVKNKTMAIPAVAPIKGEDYRFIEHL